MRKERLGFAAKIVLLVIALVVGTSGCSGQAAKTDIKIGATASLTGRGADFGSYLSNGAKMAVDEINAAGGIDGRKIQLILEDDQTDGAQVVTATKKLIYQDKVDFVIASGTSLNCLAQMPILEQESMPYMVPVAVASKILSQSAKWLCGKNNVTDDYVDEKLGEYMVSNLGLKKIAILYENSDYGGPPSKRAKAAIEKLGGQVVAYEAYNPGDTDFTAQLLKIKATNPDGFLMHAMSTQASVIAKQRLQVGLDCAYFVNQGNMSPIMLSQSGAAAEGAISATMWLPSEPDAKSQKFTQGHQALYKKDPMQHTATTYDAIYLYAQAVKKVGGTDKAKIRDYIRNVTDFTGVVGPYKFDTSTGEGLFQMKLVVVKDGQWVKLGDVK